MKHLSKLASRLRAAAAVLVTAASLLVALPSSATSAVLLSRSQLVERSSHVLRAKVQDAESRWTDDGTMIVTRTTLRVAGYAKGKGPSQLVLEQIGGTVGDKTMVLSGDARLAKGDDVVLFVKRGDSDGTVVLTAMAQAAYKVKQGKAERDMSGLSLYTRDGDRLVPVEGKSEAPEAVSKLWSEVARIARGGRP